MLLKDGLYVQSIYEEFFQVLPDLKNDSVQIKPTVEKKTIFFFSRNTRESLIIN